MCVSTSLYRSYNVAEMCVQQKKLLFALNVKWNSNGQRVVHNVQIDIKLEETTRKMTKRKTIFLVEIMFRKPVPK